MHPITDAIDEYLGTVERRVTAGELDERGLHNVLFSVSEFVSILTRGQANGHFAAYYKEKADALFERIRFLARGNRL